MTKFTILIEEYGIGHAIAALEKGRLIDFLVDPIDEEQASMIGSIVSAKLNNPVKGF